MTRTSWKSSVTRSPTHDSTTTHLLTVGWWKAIGGVIETTWGWIDKFDSQFKQIKLKNDEDFWWIPVENVVSVEA
ncbi:hypothetical protein [Brevibacillus laterosporus]|uniref:hypothetical protein n=1 Tax=Brevibacillus laterosporus TaxID=1465 RepID=UPI003458B6F9